MSENDLPYWKALAAFAFTEEEVWTNQQWRLEFPGVYGDLDRLRSAPPPEMGRVRIPHSMLARMAEQAHLFFATNDDWLVSSIDSTAFPIGYQEISAREALERYGPEHVFQAGDKGSSQVTR